MGGLPTDVGLALGLALVYSGEASGLSGSGGGPVDSLVGLSG